jgi:hypothetical protein
MDRENRKKDEPVPDGPPLGSLESRAIARRALESDGDGPPSLTVSFAETNIGENHIGKPVECDSRRATVNTGFLGTTFTRGEAETKAEFEKRVSDSLPVAGPPTLTVMWPEVISPRRLSFIARCEVNGVIEAFQSLPGETRTDFEVRMRQRWGADARSGFLSWPSHENCPYSGPAQKVKETAARLGSEICVMGKSPARK